MRQLAALGTRADLQRFAKGWAEAELPALLERRGYVRPEATTPPRPRQARSQRCAAACHGGGGGRVWVADGWRGAPPHGSLHAGEQWAAAPLHHGGEENKHAGRSRMATKCSPLPLRASIEYRHRNLARGVSTTARGQWAVRLRVPRTGSCVTIGAFAWEREAAAVADLAFLWRDIQGNGGERVCAI